MRAVIQRVKSAAVTVHGTVVGEIDCGLLVLLGVTHLDRREDALWLAQKIVKMRIFSDENDKMNLSLSDVGGSLLVVSQFTLYGNAIKGNRPSFSQAALPELANSLYQYFIEQVKLLGINVAAGKFGADMQVTLVNDGPVTLVVDTPF